MLPESLRNARSWPEFPYSDLLRGRTARTKESAPFVTHLPNAKGTRVVIGFVPDAETSFAGLTRSRRLVSELLREEPSELALLTSGLLREQSEEALKWLLSALLAAVHRMPSFKNNPESPAELDRVDLLGLAEEIPVERLAAEAEGNSLARTLTALPANHLTPTDYRERVETLAREAGWHFHFHDIESLEAEGAGAFLAVAQGSSRPDAGIVHLQYRPETGAADSPPLLALVGKGICYDTGGANLKAARHMHGMHQDMAGSAVALGTLGALTKLAVAFPVDCWLALAQNDIGPAAYRQNDVVRSLNGTTIEIIHTDAEGRMVLADTLALASRYNPSFVIDYATLTGSCVAALGNAYCGAFSNRDELLSEFIAAGRDSGERVWPFPMDPDFDDLLESEVADVKQCIIESEADHILAARFLNRFVNDIPWLHLDLAASRHRGGLAHVPTDITGFGVRFSLELLLGRRILERVS